MIYLAGWCALFGTWPLNDAGHDMNTVASAVDMAVHGWGLLGLVRWWPERRP